MDRYKVGQYAFVNFPSLGMFEWHPYSITSAPHEDQIEIYVKTTNHWTKQLYDYGNWQSDHCIVS